MSRDVTPRPGSEGNYVGDMEGAYADGVTNQNLHSRNITRMSSMSPSSDSFHRRGPFSMVAKTENPSSDVSAKCFELTRELLDYYWTLIGDVKTSDGVS
ncbi:hypothetical protein Tco_1048462 [Tanacetum coccineum]